MKDSPSHDILSAYLDGELTPQERAEVERQLAESPDDRRLLDELRTLGGRLQALPVREPQPELADRILRRVEQLAAEKNGASGTGTAALAPEAPTVPPRPRGTAGESRLPWPRWAVAAGALAASLLLIVFLTRPSHRDVARNSFPSPAESAPDDFAMPESASSDAALGDEAGELTSLAPRSDSAHGGPFAPADDRPAGTAHSRNTRELQAPVAEETIARSGLKASAATRGELAEVEASKKDGVAYDTKQSSGKRAEPNDRKSIAPSAERSRAERSRARIRGRAIVDARFIRPARAPPSPRGAARGSEWS